jgi:hypothetical protein
MACVSACVKRSPVRGYPPHPIPPPPIPGPSFPVNSVQTLSTVDPTLAHPPARFTSPTLLRPDVVDALRLAVRHADSISPGAVNTTMKCVCADQFGCVGGVGCVCGVGCGVWGVVWCVCVWLCSVSPASSPVGHPRCHVNRTSPSPRAVNLPEPADLKLSLVLGWGQPDLPPEGTLRVHMSPMPARGPGPVAAVVVAYERPEEIAGAKDTKW